MSGHVEECLPLWDDMTYDYRNPTSDIVRLCRFDHGMTGVDLFVPAWAESFELSQRYVKAPKQSCFHSSSLSLPCFTPSHPSVISENTRLKSEIDAQEKLRKLVHNSILKMSSKHREILQKLLHGPVILNSSFAPPLVRRYKRLAVIVNKIKREPVQYPAGRLTTVKIQDKDLIIHAGGRDMNRLMKIILDGHLNQESTVNQLTSKAMTTFENDGPILEIDTTCTFSDDTVLCAARTDKTCHYGVISSKCKFKKIESMKSDDKLTCVKCSPFVIGEVICTTESGFVTLRNIEGEQNISRKIETKTDSPRVDSWFGCCFGSHPRCVIASSRNSAYLFDLRRSNPKSFKLFHQPNHYLTEKEKIYAVTAYPSLDTFHLITTNSSVLLMDDRFAVQPVVKWSHLLDTPPNICRVHVSPDETSKCILLGSTSNQKISTIHVIQETNDLSGLYSNCPCFHLSNPSDFVDELVKRNGVAIHPAKRRLSLPVIGFDAVTSPNSVDTTSVFELTLAGDIFHQHLNHLENYNEGESSLNDHVVVELRKWISKVGVDSFDTKRKLPKPKNVIDPTANVKLRLIRGKCCDCYECTGSSSFGQQQHFAFEKSQSIETLEERGAERIPRENYTDKMSAALLHNWTSNDEIKLAYDSNNADASTSQTN